MPRNAGKDLLLLGIIRNMGSALTDHPLSPRILKNFLEIIKILLKLTEKRQTLKCRSDDIPEDAA